MYSFIELIRFSIILLLLIIRYPQIFINGSAKRRIAISKILEKLGPAFIKFAQLLSTRPDIIGEKLALDLQIVQDDMPPFHRDKIDKIFLANYKKLPLEIFSEFDYNAIAAASVAQVHKARMHDGLYYAVKILRPNISKKINGNIVFLSAIIKFVHNNFKQFKRFRLPEVIEILQRNLLHEADLTFEAASATQLRNNLQNDSEVYIPEIYWPLSRQEIMVMEWIDAAPINKISNLGEVEKRIILKNLVNTFCNQAYRDGIFHADMHPGNVFVANNGRIILTDFGIIGRMDKKTKFFITEILRGFLKHDYKLVAKIHFEAGYVDHKHNIDEFENACRAIGERIVGKNLAEISIGSLFSGLLKLTDDFDMSTRLELLLIQKATILLEGIANSIDKKINIWQLSEEWLHNHYMSRRKIIKYHLNKYFDNFLDSLANKMNDFSYKKQLNYDRYYSNSLHIDKLHKKNRFIIEKILFLAIILLLVFNRY